MTFTSQQYFFAHAPTDTVINTFIEEEYCKLSSSNNDINAIDVWSLESQDRFAALLVSSPGVESDVTAEDEIDCENVDFLPSAKYAQQLLKRFITRLDTEGKELASNNLANLVCHFSMARISKLPDPADSCLLTYQVPSEEGERDYDQLQIRIYPHHNDVGVAKVWEAGACLAEYLMQNPDSIRGRRLIELGAGVGLTGFIAAAIGAKSVHMTDYTDATLENLSYNVSINNKWLEDIGIGKDVVSVGYLEWAEYAENDCRSHPADILIAADVVYTVECIPDLVATVSKFLSSESDAHEKFALFATTYRNRTTFAIFEEELEKRRIKCDYRPQDGMEFVFPCYFNQPRSDVRICTMRLID